MEKENNNELKNALEQMAHEEWNDKKDKYKKIKNDNANGCFWAAVIAIIVVIFLFFKFISIFPNLSID